LGSPFPTPLSVVRLALLTVLAAWSAAAVAAPATAPWRALAPGLDLAIIDADGTTVEVLRVDPERWQTVALAVSDVGGAPRTPAQWAAEFGLRAVVNAGMFREDRRTSTGYFRSGDHVNNGVWNTRDYRQMACFEPRDPGLPRFALHDLETLADTTLAASYEVVIQNLRLIRKPGENRWSPGTRAWREVCLGEDARGRMLWIRCPQARTMHDLGEILLGLPLDLVAAQHLEGSATAQLWIADCDRAGSAAGDGPGTPLPNVLGLRPR